MKARLIGLAFLTALNIPIFSFVTFVIFLAAFVYFLLEKAYEANK